MTAPSGFVVRKASVDNAQAIATVHVLSWQSSYRDILPKEYLVSLGGERRVQSWVRNLGQAQCVTFVGCSADGQVVGFCHGGPNRDEPKRFKGEVYAIYLLDEAKRHGLGRALFDEACAALRRDLLSPIVVWVLSANLEARGFYERLGGQIVGEKSMSIAGGTFGATAYGWPET